MLIKSRLFDANMVYHDALYYKLNLLSFEDLLFLKKEVVLLIRPRLLMAAGPALGDWERVQLGRSLCIRDRPGVGPRHSDSGVV